MPLAWPEPTREMKPWAYNWWMDSAVDEPGLEYQCAEMEKAGFGGFHVIPIYGAKDDKAQKRELFTQSWAEGWKLANAAAARHGLGVDLSLGSGWCFGGAQLTKEQGGRRLVVVSNRKKLKKGANVLWEGKDANGKPVILAEQLTGVAVKRAAFGGKGPMMDPFSVDAMDSLLKPHTEFFNKFDVPKPIHSYHDSYEYSGAGWTPRFFEAFRAKRGYDLRDHLAEFAGVGDREEVCRVKCDYRETLSDLIIDDVFPRWVEWCHARGIRTRNEAHGAPANVLDFYAIADVPETEMFGKKEHNILASKLASSAAHVTGKPLVASESCTWLDEHFNETLADTKMFVDTLFLSGVNHMYFHGLCYSPVHAPWPGWCFYATLEMNPRNPFWRDVPVLNAYITRCQSLFQTWTPDEDVLVYWPLRDFWWSEKGYERRVSIPAGSWFKNQRIGELCTELYDMGYAFDYVSDRMLQRAAAGTLALPPRYRVIVVPKCRHMPEATARAIAALEKKGLHVVRDDGANDRTIAALAAAGASRMPFNASNGLLCSRFAKGGARLHFVVNQSGSIKTIKSEKPFAVMDPMNGAIRDTESLTLPFGHSVFVNGADFTVTSCGSAAHVAAAATPVSGPWILTPVCGGPELPAVRKLDAVAPWSTYDEVFCGTMRYDTTFNATAGAAARIDLGDVRESARVKLNGKDLGCRIMAPYTFDVPEGVLKAKGNKLEVEVTSLGANRIRWNDANGVNWKYFEDINIVNTKYKEFDASKWPVRTSGLVGPVTICILTYSGRESESSGIQKKE